MSTYEALRLYYKGRFEIDGDLSDWLARAIAGTQEAPLVRNRVGREAAVHAHKWRLKYGYPHYPRKAPCYNLPG